MKTNTVVTRDLLTSGRWDSDFHLPPTAIKAFPSKIIAAVRSCADVVKVKRDPTARPEEKFMYVDIASVDVDGGTIVTPQELTGEEAPSRARKAIQAYDIIISTCRPTRGAIAVVPEELHGEVCSTGFSVIRCKPWINPYYLHFVLRLESTLEQFRKFSTGASYPAILDSDVMKTMIPVPRPDIQDRIAKAVLIALQKRNEAIHRANDDWEKTGERIVGGLSELNGGIEESKQPCEMIYSVEQIAARLLELKAKDRGGKTEETQGDLFDEDAGEDGEDATATGDD